MNFVLNLLLSLGNNDPEFSAEVRQLHLFAGPRVLAVPGPLDSLIRLQDDMGCLEPVHKIRHVRDPHRAEVHVVDDGQVAQAQEIHL